MLPSWCVLSLLRSGIPSGCLLLGAFRFFPCPCPRFWRNSSSARPPLPWLLPGRPRGCARARTSPLRSSPLAHPGQVPPHAGRGAPPGRPLKRTRWGLLLALALAPGFPVARGAQPSSTLALPPALCRPCCCHHPDLGRAGALRSNSEPSQAVCARKLRALPTMASASSLSSAGSCYSIGSGVSLCGVPSGGCAMQGYWPCAPVALAWLPPPAPAPCPSSWWAQAQAAPFRSFIHQRAALAHHQPPPGVLPPQTGGCRGA